MGDPVKGWSTCPKCGRSRFVGRVSKPKEEKEPSNDLPKENAEKKK